MVKNIFFYDDQSGSVNGSVTWLFFYGENGSVTY
jgi:hypothetical protein